ncbi:MAG: hypothetical protein AB7R67_13120 [Vicinamibacterales bacterium]
MPVVVMLLVGPSASLVCLSWCDPVAAAAASCHHEQSGAVTGIGSDDTCRDAVPDSAALREESRRRGDDATLMAHAAFQVAPVATPRSPGTRAQLPSHLKRPLVTPLRI